MTGTDQKPGKARMQKVLKELERIIVTITVATIGVLFIFVHVADYAMPALTDALLKALPQ